MRAPQGARESGAMARITSIYKSAVEHRRRVEQSAGFLSGWRLMWSVKAAGGRGKTGLAHGLKGAQGRVYGIRIGRDGINAMHPHTEWYSDWARTSVDWGHVGAELTGAAVKVHAEAMALREARTTKLRHG